jgi:hypothetical protein
MGKQRVLSLTAVQSEQIASGPIPLKEFARGISLNAGERYADYRVGDSLAKLTMEELIAGEETRGVTSPYVLAGIWVGVSLFTILVVAGVGALLIRRQMRQMRKSKAFPGYREHDHALSPLFGGEKIGGANGSRRKREFNYQKFYSDMMLEVSAGPLVLQPALNGKRVQRPPAEPVAPVDGVASHTIARANMELIANQNHLIEEQKRLLQEQRRLIEEKTQLIQEKTQLLEKQAELLERDLI